MKHLKDSFRIIYNPKKRKIKIFKSTFVKQNKDSVMIIFKNKLIKLTDEIPSDGINEIKIDLFCLKKSINIDDKDIFDLNNLPKEIRRKTVCPIERKLYIKSNTNVDKDFVEKSFSFQGVESIKSENVDAHILLKSLLKKYKYEEISEIQNIINKINKGIDISENIFSLAFNFYEKKLLVRYLFSMKYKIIPEEKEIRLFGKKFYDKNKEDFKIIYNNEILELQQYFPIENIKEKNKDKLEIAVVGFKDTFDISHMFDNCSLLETLNFTDLSNEIFIKNKSEDSIIENQNYTDNYDSKETKLDEIIQMVSEENKDYLSEKNLTELFGIDENDSGLKIEQSFTSTNLTDLTNVTTIEQNSEKTSKLTINDYFSFLLNNKQYISDISYIFNDCESLLSIPDISDNVFNDLHPLNEYFIFFIFLVFHFDISGIDINDWQSLNI